VGVGEAREYRISWRRFEREALEQVGKVFEEQVAAHAGDKGFRCDIRFQVSCDDGTTYTSEAVDLFAQGSEATTKNPVAVSFSFYAFRIRDGAVPERVLFDVHQGGSGIGMDRVRVEGSDPQWVQSVFVRLKERIDSFPPSDSWYTRHRTITDWAAMLGLGSIVMLGIQLVSLALRNVWVPPAYTININRFLRDVFDLFSTLVFGAVVWGRLESRFWEAWPNVDLAFGPRHLRLAEKRRNAFKYAMATVVLPFCVAVLVDLLMHH